jgi:hypothetical protein
MTRSEITDLDQRNQRGTPVRRCGDSSPSLNFPAEEGKKINYVPPGYLHLQEIRLNRYQIHLSFQLEFELKIFHSDHPLQQS